MKSSRLLVQQKIDIENARFKLSRKIPSYKTIHNRS